MSSLRALETYLTSWGWVTSIHLQPPVELFPFFSALKPVTATLMRWAGGLCVAAVIPPRRLKFRSRD